LRYKVVPLEKEDAASYKEHQKGTEEDAVRSTRLCIGSKRDGNPLFFFCFGGGWTGGVGGQGF
jgi:acetyl esterase/lipase